MGRIWLFLAFAIAACSTAASPPEGDDTAGDPPGDDAPPPPEPSPTGWGTAYHYAFELQDHYLAGQLPNNLTLGVVLHADRLFVGTHMGLAVSGDDGHTWQTRTVGDGLPGNYIQSMASFGNALVVATERGMALSRDAGATWSRPPAPGSSITKELTVAGGCLYGLAGSAVVRSCDQAASFQTVGSFSGVGDLASVAIEGATIAAFPYSTTTFFLSGDGGQTYQTLASPAPEPILYGWFANGTIYLFTDYLTVLCNVWTSPDRGATWSCGNSKSLNVGFVNHVTSDATSVYVSSNRGFTRLSSPGLSPNFAVGGSTNFTFGHAVTPAKTYVATMVGIDVFDNVNLARVTSFTNDLLQRSFQTRSLALAGDTLIMGTEIGWVEMSPETGAIQYTASGIYDGSLRFDDSVRAVTPYQDKLFVGSSGVFVLDAQRNQIALLAPSLGLLQTYVMKMVGGKLLAGGNYGLVEIDPDTLQLRTLQTAQAINSVFSIDDVGGALYFAGAEGKIYRSDDAGATFAAVAADPTSHPILDSLAHHGDRLYAAAFTGSALYTSGDAGATWSVELAGPCATHTGTHAVRNDADRIFFFCQDGAVVGIDAAARTASFDPGFSSGMVFDRVLGAPDGTLYFGSSSYGLVSATP